MKYINFQNAGYVIFEETIGHDNMASKFPYDKVISAGFVKAYSENDEASFGAYGESVTLKIKSDPKTDSETITRRMSPY